MGRRSIKRFFRWFAIAVASICTLAFGVVLVAMSVSEEPVMLLRASGATGSDGLSLTGLVLWLIFSVVVFVATWALVKLLGWWVVSMLSRGH